MTWHLNRFSRDMIDEIANHTYRYDVQDIRRAAKDAELHYLDNTFGCDIEWMTRVQTKLYGALRDRGEALV